MTASLARTRGALLDGIERRRAAALITARSLLFFLFLAGCSAPPAPLPEGALPAASRVTTRLDTSSAPPRDAASVATSLTALGAAGAAHLSLADAWVDGYFSGAQAQRGTNLYCHPTSCPGGGAFVRWPGDPDPSGGTVDTFDNQSDCSFFVSALLKRAYRWQDVDLVSWLCGGDCTDRGTATRPQAVHYFDAIRRGGSHFTRISAIEDVAAGDLIAIVYPDDSANTGHVLWVDAAPVSAPMRWGGKSGFRSADYNEYTVSVIDSSSSYHGTSDLRYSGLLDGGAACEPGPSGDDACRAVYGAQTSCAAATSRCAVSGVGRGTMGLFVARGGARAGKIAGYSWSHCTCSDVHMNADGDDNQIVVGRYDGYVRP